MASETAPPREEDDGTSHDALQCRQATASNPNSANNSVPSQLLPNNLANSPLLPIIPTTTTTTTTTSKTITIGGVTIAVESSEQVRPTTGALYTKAFREKFDDDKEGILDLLELVQGKQQQLYSAISISVNDPEKLLDHYSLSELNKECRRNLAKYDLISPFNIVFPTSPGGGSLLLNDEGAIVSHDLFTNTHCVTAQQVADSSRWYRGFTAAAGRFQEDLIWSLAYFENNVDSVLYARIHSKILTYDERSRGGPLFFKLLNDETTTTTVYPFFG